MGLGPGQQGLCIELGENEFTISDLLTSAHQGVIHHKKLRMRCVSQFPGQSTRYDSETMHCCTLEYVPDEVPQ